MGKEENTTVAHTDNTITHRESHGLTSRGSEGWQLRGCALEKSITFLSASDQSLETWKMYSSFRPRGSFLSLVLSLMMIGCHILWHFFCSCWCDHMLFLVWAWSTCSTSLGWRTITAVAVLTLSAVLAWTPLVLACLFFLSVAGYSFPVLCWRFSHGCSSPVLFCSFLSGSASVSCWN